MPMPSFSSALQIAVNDSSSMQVLQGDYELVDVKDGLQKRAKQVRVLHAAYALHQ